VPRGEPLKKWTEHLQQGWQKIIKGDQQIEQYCHQALLGVALLILEEGDVKHHTVNIALANETHLLRFKARHPLFHLENGDKKVGLWEFEPMTEGGKPFADHLQFDEINRVLKPMEPDELSPNPIFSVYGFEGFTEGTPLENKLVKAPAKRHSLFSTTFTRLIVANWQFKRIDWAAKQLRPQLQAEKVKYANYANEYQDARPHCTSTRQLEYQLQKMQIFCNDAVFLLSRIQSALKTLEINGKNFARRLEEIRHETPDNPWQLDFKEKIQLRAENELSVLMPFYRAIRRLENHQVYIESQVKYLKGLQERWQLYLAQRQTQAGETLNILGTILFLLLAGTGVADTALTFNSKLIGVEISEKLVYLMIALLSVPLFWRMSKWVAKKMCCLFHGTWFDQVFCQRVFQWLNELEFFRGFIKLKNHFKRKSK
jgi:hypothetical protein